MAKKKSPLVEEIDVVYVNIEKLNPAPYNPRAISESALEKLKNSIQHFGTVDPLIVRRLDNLVIGGHQRLQALRELGWPKVPVVYIDLNDAQTKALNIQLNNPNSQGTWDDEKLMLLLDDLQHELPDIEVTGFNLHEISELKQLPEFSAGSIDDQQRLDEKMKVKCPECGNEFTP